jgi:hypothetical protein
VERWENCYFDPKVLDVVVERWENCYFDHKVLDVVVERWEKKKLYRVVCWWLVAEEVTGGG